LEISGLKIPGFTGLISPGLPKASKSSPGGFIQPANQAIVSSLSQE
jgi:hypothetical protein